MARVLRGSSSGAPGADTPIMTRLTALWQASPLRVVGALFALSLAAMMGVASGASFTSQSANAGNVVAAGNLQQSNSVNGAFLTVSGLKPGASQSGSTTITNTGDLTGVFTLSKANLVNSDTANPFSSKLDLVVDDLGDPAASPAPAPITRYTGKLGAMGTIALGNLAAGAVHRYRFTVTFPDGGAGGADNAYKGDDVTVDYVWDAVNA